MRLERLHSVYFLGIGGIGMSAIGRWFHHRGIPVYGYDRQESPLTLKLAEEGMQINYEDTVENIAPMVKEDPENILVVWTPAIPKDSRQLAYFRENGFALKKRAEVLGMITQSMNTVAVAGTHGKTTTSSIVAHLLKSAGKNMAAFLGGLTQNYGSNFILHEGEGRESPTVVVEADEFDRSFLHLHPNTGIVTSVDPDHLDIYGDAGQMVQGFVDFIGLISRKGRLYIQTGAFNKLQRESLGNVPHVVYGMSEGEVHAENVSAGTLSFKFDYVGPGKRISGLELKVPGFHNVENALAAIAVVDQLGLTEAQIREGLSSFKGVKRRFEFVYQDDKRVYIDDYAHHPEEIRAFLSSVKAMYPQRRLTAIFQPHLFTRTRDFASGFSESLSLADEVVLLDIYPAREEPIPGVHAEMLLPEITAGKKSLQKKENLLDYLKASDPEVLVTLGAGDIDRLVGPIANWIRT
ncbi:MAG TPA: UDP-N-acetylmuramate--L-alanine ligase [Cyclobacteriaceae bacterium]|nr:UDP-N-acetylmuramate--L-alanine ligase [Cyclobacteriaceae bacterium]